MTIGETLNIYSSGGTLVYNDITTDEEMDIPLRGAGMYIVISGDRSVRVVFEF